LLVTCLCIGSSRKGLLYMPLHRALAMPFGSHGGDNMVQLLLSSLRSHPASWGLGALQARCATVCGDGALCEGGPEHRHRSTAAAEKLWRAVHPDGFGSLSPPPPMCTMWDPFHRIDAAAWRAIRSVPAAVLVFDTAKQLDYMFGQSDGALLYKGVVAFMGQEKRARQVRAPGGPAKSAIWQARLDLVWRIWICCLLHVTRGWRGPRRDTGPTVLRTCWT
jgi:hypothetical protein